MGYRMIRMRSNEDAMETLNKAKDLLESATEMLETACEMLKNGMDERGGMMRDSRGRYSGRDYRDERMMRRDGDWDNDMPRGRYGY